MDSTDKPTRVAALRAAAAGSAAARSGQPVGACPYSQQGALTQRFLRRYWLRGHTAQLNASTSTRP